MAESANRKLVERVRAHLSARDALLVIVTPEEARIEKTLLEIASACTYEMRFWDCVAGVVDSSGKEVPPGKEGADPSLLLEAIRRYDEAAKRPRRNPKDRSDVLRAMWVFRDFAPMLKDQRVLRATKSLALSLPRAPTDCAQVMVILSTTEDLPPEIRDLAKIIKWELPDRQEIGSIFDAALRGFTPEEQAIAAPPGTREAAIEAAVGLSAVAARSAFSRSLVTQDKKIVPAVIAEEKERVVKGKGIEWFRPDPRGLDAVGGLEPLKQWLKLRQSAFSEEARAYGLPTPKGIILVGQSGCGKSLVAKAVATAWGKPLLRFDPGGQKSKYVGDSEANTRAAYSTVDAVGDCILWIDEVEKQFAGVGGGAADGGVTDYAFGAFLTWMQERKGSAFVIVTANDVSKLPPEFLRKGRFDEIFFVDLPTYVERLEIWRVSLLKMKRDPSKFDLPFLASTCRDFTGSEIAAVVESGLFIAFDDGKRELTTRDLMEAAKTVVPLAETAKEIIVKNREWAKSRARMASLPEKPVEMEGEGPVLDFGSKGAN